MSVLFREVTNRAESKIALSPLGQHAGNDIGVVITLAIPKMNEGPRLIRSVAVPVSHTPAEPLEDPEHSFITGLCYGLTNLLHIKKTYSTEWLLQYGTDPSVHSPTPRPTPK